MRRFHNPRFAPESLERKLNPSGVMPVPVAAEVHVPTAQASHATQATPTVHPTSIVVAKAATVSTHAVLAANTSGAAQLTSTHSTSTVVASHQGHHSKLLSPDGPVTQPSDPDDTDGGSAGGTGPEPPDGDGSPQPIPPSNPSGPPL
jgi:hypothetical protein